MFNSDIPIETKDNDLLGRSNFSQSLAEAIINYNNTNSISIGLYGEWGSGKTSVINMTLEHINTQNLNTKEENKTLILKFNPWNYSDQNQLILQYFKQLSILLKRKDHSESLRKAGDKIESYAKLLIPLKFIPVIGQYSEIAQTAIESVGSSLNAWGDEKDLITIKEELNSILELLNQKILVVIDDIDRLNNAEIRQIFQLVKSTGDFKNTIYLLSFDKKVVIRALSKVQEGDGSQYLEKVIQVPFEIPSIPQKYLEKILFQQLDEIINDVSENAWDSTYWANIYHSGLKFLILSLRDINRYINSLRFSYNIIKSEVNAIDFLAITALQVFIPEVYSGIKNNKDVFCYNKTYLDHYSSSTIRDKYKIIVDEVISAAPTDIRENILSLLKYLFPNIITLYGNSSYGSGFINEWRSKCRICCQDIFDIYFKLSLYNDEISQIEITNFLENSNNIQSTIELLLDLHEKNKISRFLERLEDYTREVIPLDNVQNIVSALMDIGDLFLDENDFSFFGTSNSMRLLRIFYQLSQRYNDQTQRFTLFKEAMENSKNSLYTLIHEVSVQCQQHGKYNFSENPEQIENCTVNPEQLNKLELIACNKIEKYYSESKLLQNERLVSILYMWKKWCINNKYQEFIDSIILDENDLLLFLTKFLSKSRSYGIGDYTAKTNLYLNYKSINEFIDVNTIEPTIRKVFISDNYNSLSSDTKLTISLFLDFFDGKNKNEF